MSPMTSFARTTAGLALGLAALAALTAGAAADDSKWYNVKDMLVSTNNVVPELVVRNIAGNHLIANLNLSVQGNTVPVSVGGAVNCLGITSENLIKREGAFLSGGAFGIGRSSLLLSEALPNSSSIDHVSDLDAHTFQMPVALLANPQIGIDPVAVVLAAADKAPDRLQYLRQDHVIMAELPIRWESTCKAYTRYKVAKETIIEANQPLSYLTKDVALKIVYKGDPQLFAVNAQIAQGGNMPNQLQAGDQPFKMIQMTFQPNMPHHSGACPATTKIRVNYMGQGKGEIRIRINDGSLTIYDSPKIAFDSKNGKQHHDFEIATPKASPSDLNKTVVHDLRVFVRGKGENEQVWPATFQLMDSAAWKHRCTPQLNPSIGGNAAVGGYKGGNGQGGAPNLPKLPLKATPTEPAPAIKRAP